MEFSRELSWGLKAGKASIRPANPGVMDTTDKIPGEPHSPAQYDYAQLVGADAYLDARDCSVSTGIRSLSLPPWRKNIQVDLRRRKAQQLKRMARQRNLTLAQHYAREYCVSPERSPLGSFQLFRTVTFPSLLPAFSTITVVVASLAYFNPTLPVSALLTVPKLPTTTTSESLNDTVQCQLSSFEHTQQTAVHQLELAPRSLATSPRAYNYKSSYWQHRSRERISTNLGPKASLDLQERPYRTPVRIPGPALQPDAQQHLPSAQESALFIAGKLEGAAPEKAPRRILSVSKLLEFSAPQAMMAPGTASSSGPATESPEHAVDHAQNPQSPTFGPSMSSDATTINGPGIHSVLSHDGMSTTPLLSVTKPKRRPPPFNFSHQNQHSASILAKSVITTALTPTTATSCVTRLLQEPCLTPGPYTGTMSIHTSLEPEEQDRQNSKKSRRIWDHRRLIPKLKSNIASSSSASYVTASPTVSNFSSIPISGINSPLNFYFSNSPFVPATPTTPSPRELKLPKTRVIARGQGHSHSKSADSSFVHILAGTTDGDADNKQASNSTTTTITTTTTKSGSTIFYSAPVSLCPVESRPQSPELGCPIESIALPKDYMTRPLDSICLPWSAPLPLTPSAIPHHQQRRPSEGAFNKDPTPSSYVHPGTSSAPSSPKSATGSSIGRKKSFHEKLFGKKAKKIFLSMESLSSLPSLPYSHSNGTQLGMNYARESQEMDRTVYYHNNGSGHHDYYQDSDDGDGNWRGGQRLQDQQDFYDEYRDHQVEMGRVAEKDDSKANENIWKVMGQWRRWKKNHQENMKR
ncbi:hypothetical protein EC968_003782 [Mortierella alpina]|nr:hypothetical protein EC968_003782 [Mortierella alpina]